MTIEIYSPEAEAIIRRRISAGGFKNAEEVIIQALKASPAAEMPAASSASQKPLHLKTLGELCDPIRGLMDDIEFSRNPSTARPHGLGAVFYSTPTFRRKSGARAPIPAFSLG
jgi:hypothetical protein